MPSGDQDGAALGVLVLREAEEEDGADPLGVGPPGGLHDLVHGMLEDPGHGGDRVGDPLARADEEGEDQVVGGQPGLPHQAAQVRGTAETAESGFWEHGASGFIAERGERQRPHRVGRPPPWLD